MSDSGRIFIEKYFSKNIAKQIIMKDLKINYQLQNLKENTTNF